MFTKLRKTALITCFFLASSSFSAFAQAGEVVLQEASITCTRHHVTLGYSEGFSIEITVMIVECDNGFFDIIWL